MMNILFYSPRQWLALGLVICSITIVIGWVRFETVMNEKTTPQKADWPLKNYKKDDVLALQKSVHEKRVWTNRIVKIEKPVVEEKTVEPNIDWRVAGIVDTPKGKSAIIAIDGSKKGTTQRHKVGDTMPNGETLLSIEQDRLFVRDKDGQKIEYDLYEFDE
jgi:hypothetical protein